jgi:hypothetical protein
MPTKIDRDNKGCYAQWGDQEKYYYECNNVEARKRAIEKANKQGQAIKSNNN